jgi:hypothetical protein
MPSGRLGPICLETGANALGDFAAVLALKHEGRADHDFPAIGAGRTQPRRSPGFDRGDILHAHDLAVARQHRRLRQLIHVAQPRIGADDIGFACAADIACACDAIGVFKRVNQLHQSDAIRRQLRRIGVNAVFLHIATEHVDAGDAFHAAQLRRDDPVLHGAKVRSLVQRGGQTFTFRRHIDGAILGDLRRELDGPDIDFAEAGNDRAGRG